MKLRHVFILTGLLVPPALAQPPPVASDVCILEYREAAYHLYKGGKLFSDNIGTLDAALETEQGLIDTGICKPQKTVCNILFDGLIPGYYFIYKDKKLFSSAFSKLLNAERAVDKLISHGVCRTPDEP